MDATDGTIAPSNIVINGKEYSSEEAQELIETGRKTHDYETKYNTKFENIWPDYTRLSQEKSQWQTEKQKYESQIAEFEKKQTQGVETPEDIKKAKEAARNLGLVLSEDLSSQGYIKKDELDEYFNKKIQEQESVKSVLAEADRLKDEIDKSDAPVKFKKKAVLAYAGAYGISDLRQAYEEMNSDILGPWKEAQIASKKSQSLKTLATGGKKSPTDVRVTNDNVKELLHEALIGS